jgi:hypothetical protein
VIVTFGVEEIIVSGSWIDRRSLGALAGGGLALATMMSGAESCDWTALLGDVDIPLNLGHGRLTGIRFTLLDLSVCTFLECFVDFDSTPLVYRLLSYAGISRIEPSLEYLRLEYHDHIQVALLLAKLVTFEVEGGVGSLHIS